LKALAPWLLHAVTMVAETFCLASAGAFFLVGLITGTWKYHAIAMSSDARAPVYVDIAHRTSLQYAFACALMAQLAARGAWSNATNLVASIVLVVFFASAVAGYIIHGILRDTDNQLRRPHVLGRRTVSPAAVRGFMTILIAAEITGFAVLFAGFLAA
jgi:hypothetical protein